MSAATGKQEKRYFIITSHGRTATYWLASCLNAHPEIVCTHGPVLPPVLEYHDQPADEYTKYAHETLNRFYAKTVDDVFEELENAQKATLYGHVHAYSVEQLYNLKGFGTTRRKPVIYNLVRHPVSRIESLKRRLMYELSFNPYINEMLDTGFVSYVTPDVLDNILNEVDVDLNDMDVRAFVYSACFVPTNDLKDFQWPVQHIPMERLTKDIEYYIWFLSLISQGQVMMTSNYIHNTFNTKRKNEKATETSSMVRYESWEEWKKKVFRIIMEKFDCATMYRTFGYDLKYTFSGNTEVTYKYPLIYPIMPELIEENYLRYNIIFYKNSYFGLSQRVGQVDLTTMNQDSLNQLYLRGLCFIGQSLNEVREKITTGVQKDVGGKY